MGLFINLLILFLVAIWLALVYWTYSDVKRRTEDPMLIGCATLGSLFPFVGAVVYAIVRPPEYIEDTHERRLEIQAAQSRLKQLQRQSCPNCSYPVEASYLRCPSCMFKLKEQCPSCSEPVDPAWRLCPFCEEAIEAGGQSDRSQGKKSTAAQ